MGSELELLVEVLDHGFNKASWHGPNLASSFRGVDAPTAARSLRGRKCIWQQVLHAAYWKQRVLNRLIGTQRFPRPGSNWPRLPQKITAGAWKADQHLLHEIHRQLRAAVADLDPARLSPKLKRMIYGVAAHDVYHAGQIRLLRKLLAETR
ncbi:DinB family protein [Fontivita pretiosa]|uniref:DinB family protein n=1 Tax=Fontivita pretiosa TaxID=2989684 RepID=UPI003D17F17B